MAGRRVVQGVQGKSMRTWQADIAAGAEGEAYVSMVGGRIATRSAKGVYLQDNMV
jgi:hypothetical protein